jgi:predicted transcriptional regulator
VEVKSCEFYRIAHFQAVDAKVIAKTALDLLPNDASWESILDRMRYLAAIDEGLRDIEAGRVVPHEEVKRQLHEWLQK